jgi:hypothetical protein
VSSLILGVRSPVPYRDKHNNTSTVQAGAEGQATQGSVVSVLAAFTLEHPLFCIPRTSGTPKNFSSCGQGSYPFVPEEWFVHTGALNIQASWCPLSTSESRENKKSTEICTGMGELRAPDTRPATVTQQ